MTQDELIQRLQGYEWNDVEFKKAQRGVPEDAYKTVSAFSNTAGGWLVFGVKEGDGNYEVVGVLEVDKVQNDFLSVLRSAQKLNRRVVVTESMLTHDEKTLLVFHIPEMARTEKPVYMGRDIRESYIRRGAGDEKCTPTEIERFLRDASTDRYDGFTVDCDLQNCFDDTAIAWYRNVYERKPGNRSYADKSDIDFLFELGLLRDTQGGRKPSRAAILMFGQDGYFRDLLPRPVADCQRYTTAFGEYVPGMRWADRAVFDFNLVRCWQALLDWYQKITATPFNVDPTSLQRTDMPPDYIAFRETVVNVLIHQDYADHSRKAEIRHFTDQTMFWNPGDAFASLADLLDPGEKEVRNPRIVTVFRRIGLSENAGWGLRDVFTNWQQLGNVPPVITNDKSRKTFELVLRRETLLSEEQILFQAQIGVHLDEESARLFAYVCREQEITIADAKAVLALSTEQSLEKVRHLVTQGLVREIETESAFSLAEHLVNQVGTDQAQEELVTPPTDQVEPGPDDDLSAETAQVARRHPDDLSTGKPGLVHLTDVQRKILPSCEVPQALSDLQDEAGFGNRGYFKSNVIDPLLAANLLRMTIPNKPTSSKQKYVLTDDGLRLVQSWRKSE
ncbi:MAG: AAA family ATPase [Lentisphaerae bacterium]|jgi:ATP-dependent DNA helicase RecG|nr:AAA family ATPase [Lentisphaerota bacterium]MBT4818761.1 AAA family ATPase [Lentisphaerota bacterium]MBT7058633.1 AAA family ATPase [Lentisphaerota bacterium]MBT7847614.1 AAA family ATPase [Lentisphaerota bacterium]